jgi:transcription initiation factor TFIIIB Brf1 subunit/transcription initiation factor TFIIB
MLASECVEGCSECGGKVVDTGDELVCMSCGAVVGKEVVDGVNGREPQAIDYTGHALGGYMGPMDYGYEEIFSKGFSGASSTFRYLKLVSDYSGKEDSSVYACAKMIERVCEKLSLPRIVVSQAVVIAKRLFCVKRSNSDVTVAAVSAYSIASSCKVYGVTSVGLRDIIAAHRALGRRVKVSAMIKLSLESPFRYGPRRAEDYLTRVVARLSSNRKLVDALRSSGISETAYFNKLRAAASEALSAVDQAERGGHNPCALAATAVYAAEVVLSGIESRKRLLTQRDVAECVDIAEYTVREQYGEIFRNATGCQRRTDTPCLSLSVKGPEGP